MDVLIPIVIDICVGVGFVIVLEVDALSLNFNDTQLRDVGLVRLKKASLVPSITEVKFLGGEWRGFWLFKLC